MGRLRWPLALVVAFVAGWLAAGAVRPGEPPAPEVDRLQSQVSALRARLYARDTLAAERQAGPASPGAGSAATAAGPGAPPAAAAPPGERVVGALATEERVLHDLAGRRGAPGGAGAPPDARGAGAAAPATVEAALERFYRYLEATTGTDGRERWQRARELVDELRRMGEVAGQALIQVLAAGSDSDERRAAARLLGQLQVAQAVPALRSILDREDDVLLRRAAASGLRQIQTPESLPVMERILGTPGEDRFVRLSAAYGLAEAGRTQGVSALAHIFDESTADGRGREIAFRALASLRDDRPLPFMRQLVTSQAEPSYRLRAIQFLTAQGDRQALAALQTVMQTTTEQPSIRDAAARAHAVLSGR
jgi:hypothetical protein